MVGSTAETTVNRGETIKDREKARSEARGGSETDKGKSRGRRVINTLSNEWNLDLNGICDLLKICYMTFCLTCTCES